MPQGVDVWFFFYLILALLATWSFAYTIIAAGITRRRSWRILSVMVGSMVVVFSALVIQRSPWSDTDVDAFMVYVQRFSLMMWAIASMGLVYYLLTLENGRLAVVRDAMLLRPLWCRARLVFQPHRESHGGGAGHQNEPGTKINETQ